MSLWTLAARSSFRQCTRTNIIPPRPLGSRPFSLSPFRFHPRVRGHLDEVPPIPRARNAFEEPFANEIRRPSVLGPALFAVGLSAGAYGLGALYTNWDTNRWKVSLLANFMSVSSNNDLLSRYRKMELGNRLSANFERLKSATAALPEAAAHQIQHLYLIVANNWLNTPEGKRTCYAITALNALIFVAWQIPRLGPIMRRGFMHHPLSGKSYTMITSVFSHVGVVHFAFNTIGLLSFGPTVHALLQRDSEEAQSTSRFHFLAFFLSAGVFASFVSHLVTARFRFPRLVAQLADPVRAKALSTADAAILPSLGASGAIYGLLTYTALSFPELSVSLIFLPMIPLPITGAVGGMVALDIIGLIRGWKSFDHWAHLAGAASGVIYYGYGMPFWHWFRAKMALIKT
ncbi:hypothetical protein BOTBODRAFT_28566 [Botryobasidium botryosum FD-172 SS1]|uniref:Peptidase S54 rhomboid domain-containing protein n=1 Tax=Botryobasidium botryosum (strain FD-172 SS1) TaxID=930990 RepID=A0A067N4K8_BOTB1|nr:hypothetical protein BOTBODRAFT_28566 [Botryobasidium botryosum FD-172 SS1]